MYEKSFVNLNKVWRKCELILSRPSTRLILVCFLTCTINQSYTAGKQVGTYVCTYVYYP